MTRLTSRGFGSKLVHLLSSLCLNVSFSSRASYPTNLLSSPHDKTRLLWRIPATPITADECKSLWRSVDFHSLFLHCSRHNTTAWSHPPVMKQGSSQGVNMILLISPLLWGLSFINFDSQLCRWTNSTREYAIKILNMVKRSSAKQLFIIIFVTSRASFKYAADIWGWPSSAVYTEKSALLCGCQAISSAHFFWSTVTRLTVLNRVAVDLLSGGSNAG